MILSQVHVTAAVSAEGFRYCKSHEWASLEGNIATIGISNYAQVLCVCVCGCGCGCVCVWVWVWVWGVGGT